MKIFFTALICISFCTVTVAQDTAILNKWKRAVVNLELRTYDTTGYAKEREARLKLFERLQKKDSIKKLSDREFLDSMSAFSRNVKRKYVVSSGTAVYFKHNGKRYLITARHVVHDEIQAHHRYLYKTEQQYDSTKIYRVILIRHNYDRIMTEKRNRKYKLQYSEFEISDSISFKSLTDSITTTNKPIFGVTAFDVINNTPQDCIPYTFSSSLLDLAIISLDSKKAFYGGVQYKNLGEYLDSNGYIPISSNDFTNECHDGLEVFALGFPGATSRVAKYNTNVIEDQFMSGWLSLPVFSFGKIGVCSPLLPYLWSDISVYPGNSGGPLIQDGKLLGIITKQATVENTRIPFGKATRSKYIFELLKIQDRKDSCQVAQ